MSRDWKSAKGTEVSFNWADKKPGDSVEGYYFDVQTGVGEKGTSSIYTLKQENGEKIAFWGSAVLDDQFTKFGLGTYCKVIYNGKVKAKSSSSQYHSFEVMYDDSDVMDMSAGNPVVQNSPVEQPQKTQQASVQQVAPATEPEDDLPF